MSFIRKVAFIMVFKKFSLDEPKILMFKNSYSSSLIPYEFWISDENRSILLSIQLLGENVSSILIDDVNSHASGVR